MRKLLTILAALAELLTRFFRAKEQQEHDKQTQQIKKDPAVWFDDHFNSDDNGVRPNEPMPNNANETEQTSTKKRRRNKRRRNKTKQE